MFIMEYHKIVDNNIILLLFITEHYYSAAGCEPLKQLNCDHLSHGAVFVCDMLFTMYMYTCS